LSDIQNDDDDDGDNDDDEEEEDAVTTRYDEKKFKLAINIGLLTSIERLSLQHGTKEKTLRCFIHR